ncbi:hypothetical protein Hypma_010482 [Hypsizygus marmoreus]|uniref:Uncharacterized protein n=1 Tax=Hypsizygus marmoreus TaxID=39966 RepID=A0A369JJJ4_HYPMA|nr:hypothetical protein Hypma_010482 [Hypsizygus marmoreus]
MLWQCELPSLTQLDDHDTEGLATLTPQVDGPRSNEPTGYFWIFSRASIPTSGLLYYIDDRYSSTVD